MNAPLPLAAQDSTDVPSTAMLRPLQLGTHQVWPPVVLAPMAGVTNAPFRTMCRRFAPGLVYVNEMVMATALVHGNAKTARMATFGPDDEFRSLQIYGSDPAIIGEAVRRLAGEDRVDHIDLNFGCPAAKVTRRGTVLTWPAAEGDPFIAPADEVELYRFSGGEYRLQ